MALYGEARDISFFRHVNRELMGNIISEQVVYYKYKLAETKTNMYGEASEGRNFMAPVTLNALIERSEQEYPESDLGVDFDWNIIFKFLRDDLLNKNPETDNLTTNVYGADLVPEVGDIIMYNNGYYEVDNTNANQFFVGKNPDYPYNDDTDNNPLSKQNTPENPAWNLGNFGYSVSIICKTHYAPVDRINIIKERL